MKTVAFEEQNVSSPSKRRLGLSSALLLCNIVAGSKRSGEDKMIHRAQIATIPEYVHWHNEIKPHMSLDWENLETPIQAFHRKLPQDRKEITQTIQEAK